jgi:hypothetical protein
MHDSHDKPPEDALPSPSTSPSRYHTKVDRNKRYSPILGRPTPLAYVPAKANICEHVNLKSINIQDNVRLIQTYAHYCCDRCSI